MIFSWAMRVSSSSGILGDEELEGREGLVGFRPSSAKLEALLEIGRRDLVPLRIGQDELVERVDGLLELPLAVAHSPIQ